MSPNICPLPTLSLLLPLWDRRRERERKQGDGDMLSYQINFETRTLIWHKATSHSPERQASHTHTSSSLQERWQKHIANFGITFIMQHGAEDIQAWPLPPWTGLNTLRRAPQRSSSKANIETSRLWCPRILRKCGAGRPACFLWPFKALPWCFLSKSFLWLKHQNTQHTFGLKWTCHLKYTGKFQGHTARVYQHGQKPKLGVTTLSPCCDLKGNKGRVVKVF
jgi:hypothetical protein